MSNKASRLKSAIDAYIERRGIDGMDQNLMKEAIHLHSTAPISFERLSCRTHEQSVCRLSAARDVPPCQRGSERGALNPKFREVQ
jgi:hypothetical protein